MDSVYDAARAHAEKLKAELETLQNFLTLHDHFREHFGLTPSQKTSQAAPSDAGAPVIDQAAATHESQVQAPAAEAEDVVEAHTPEAEASESDVAEPAPLLHAEPEAATEAEPVVIRASEGVLIAATSETTATEPLGPEATLQSVAEKLAATIGAAHPSVAGYTV